MILGHYGVAFAAKRATPGASLGTLAFAAQFLDELWPILVLAGVEHVQVRPGLMAANPLEFSYYPFSHSLLFAIIWGVIIAAIHYAARRDARAAIVLALLVVSHWVLDVPMHAPDLPLAPGLATKVGLGAWRSIPLTLCLELGIFGIGVAMYARGTRARDRIGSWGFAITVIVLLAILASGYGPPPPNGHAVAVGALGLWALVPLLWWIDRHRSVVAQA
jgi:hypothetical protein